MASREEIDAWVGSDPRRLQAKAWVDRVNAATGLSGGWRLQVMSLRSRQRFPAPADGESESESDSGSYGLTAADGSPVYLDRPAAPAGCSERPARVRRFVSGCPWAILEPAVRYLYATAPYTGIVFNGVKSDRTYRPTLTQWTRDAQTQVGADATYTLVQDLVETSACRDEEVVPTGESCLQAETTTFRWDEAYVDPPEALGPCAQGETSSVQSVRRNEDGTFDYQLARTVARTRHVPEHPVACDASHTVLEERWENLYGAPGAWRCSEDACGSVSLEGLPGSSCSSAAKGVRVTWEVQLNRDCTYSISRRVATAHRLRAAWTDGTSCRPTVHEEVRGSTTAPESAMPSAGQRVDLRVQLDEDGSYSWSKSVRDAPAADVVQWTDGSLCRTRSVLHATDVRSKSGALGYIPSRAAGRTVDAQVTRNEDCTWDVRVSSTEAPAAETVAWADGSPCRPREHVRAMNVPTRDGALGYVHERAAGFAVDAQVTRNEDCTWDVVSTRAQTAPPWSASWTDGSPGVSTTHHRVAEGQLSPPSVQLEERSLTRATIRRADDCTYSSEVAVTRSHAASASWTEGTSCRPVTVHASWGAETPASVVPSAGHDVSVSVQRNPDGTFDSVVRDRAPDDAAVSWVHGSSVRPVQSTAYSGRASIPALPGAAVGKTVSASFSRDGDCTYSGRVDVAQSRSGQFSYRSGSPCALVDNTVYDHVASVPQPSTGAQRRVDASFSREEDGTYSGRTAVTDYSAGSGDVANLSWESEVRSPTHVYKYENRLLLFRHRTDVPDIPHFGDVSVNMTMEDDCTFSGSVKATRFKGWTNLNDGGGGGGSSAVLSRHRYEFMVCGGVVFKRRIDYSVHVYGPGTTVTASMVADCDRVIRWGDGWMAVTCLDDDPEWKPA